MTDRTTGVTRRRLLAGMGLVGTAGVGASFGTRALFSDSGEFGNATLAATDFLEVGWEEHYYNGQAPPDNGENVESLRRVGGPGEVGDDEVGLPDPDSPLVAVAAEDLAGFMQASEAESGSPEDDPNGVVTLEDVKPGDFGEITYSYRLLDDPGYVTLDATVQEDAENDIIEPETDVDNSPDAGELGESVQAALWYDHDCDNVFDSEEEPIVRGTLNEVMAFLGADPPGSNVTSREPLVLDPTDSGGRTASDYPGTHCHSVVDSSVDCSEVFYFTDVEDGGGGDIFSSPDDDTTKLYEATIEDTNGDSRDEANITELYDFDGNSNYDHIVSMAASTDGTKIYLIDKFSEHFGVYDVSSESFEDKGKISNLSGTSLQAAVSPSGALYFTVWGESKLYVIEDPDANNPSVDDTITLTGTGGNLGSVGGSDIAFLSDGSLYLIDGNVSDDTADLYELSDPSTGQAEFVAELPSNVGLPGIAVRASGSGNLIGIDAPNDRLYEFDSADGSKVATYETRSDGAKFNFANAGGDMTVGPLCPRHCVALAWWVPGDVGNEIQSDRYTFDITFRAEECANNTKLVNHWPLDSINDGTAEDVVGGIDGTPQGGISAASGKVGGAASFDGTDDYIEVPDDPSLTPQNITLSVWLKTTDSGGGKLILDKDDWQANDGGYFLSISGGTNNDRPRFLWEDTAGTRHNVVANTTVNDGDWHHLAATYDGSVMKIYVDGDVDESSAVQFTGRDSATSLEMMRDTNSGKTVQGTLDDVRLYDRALSDSEVDDIYQGTM